MKKLIFLLLLTGLFADTLVIEKPYNLRTVPNAGVIFDHTVVGDKYMVLETKGPYVYVEFTSNTDHVGKKGWVWVKRVKNNEIIIEGVNLRSTPEKRDDNIIAQVKKGAKCAVFKNNATWLKLDLSCRQNSTYPFGWVYYKTGKVK